MDPGGDLVDPRRRLVDGSYACPFDDTASRSVPYKSLGDAPRYCDFWYSKRCNLLTDAETGLDTWWDLSCLSGLKPWPGLDNGLACDMMNHYMGASGDDVSVNVDDLLGKSEFKDSVNKTLFNVSDRATSMCGNPPCVYSFDSGWKEMSFEKDVSQDMFYAFRGMTYQVTGSITVDKDGRTSAAYQVTAYKAWNFDKDEYLQGVPFRGPANAAGFGLAREFAVVGTSSCHLW